MMEKHRDNSGFTLIELIVVITIIASLLALGLSVGYEAIIGQKNDATRNLIIKINAALSQYRSKCKANPPGGQNGDTRLLLYWLEKETDYSFSEDEKKNGVLVDYFGEPLFYNPNVYENDNNPNVLILSKGADRIDDRTKDPNSDDYEKDDIRSDEL